MTVRLVALMSIVLLLSLAAFGLLLNHYQDAVMQEVARTAGDVGKATLRSLEFGPGVQDVSFRKLRKVPDGVWVGEGGTGPVGPDGAPTEQTFEFTAEVEAIPEGVAVEGEPGEQRLHGGTDRQIIVVTANADGNVTREIREFVRMGGPGRAESRVRQLRCDEAERSSECEAMQHAAAEFGKRIGDEGFVAGNVIVDLDEVHAEHAGTYQLMLKIPTLTPRMAGEEEPARADWHYRMPADDEGNDFLLADKEEIRLPIEVGDYHELYRSLRDRSLFLFLGVFLVGTVLSAGLATRFTRPIRRLDSGIRKISDGDLDAEVEVQGKDEIGRLGVAFNDMTRKLRENRDRGRELVRREKLSALGGLAAGVAHDVRNPLHSIGLTLQHLRETARPERPEAAAEFDRSMDIIRGEIRRLDQTVSNFLRFSRSERRERQPVDLADLLEETTKLVRKEAEWRRIDVRVEHSSMIPAISAEAESLRASLLNLVLNSFDAMPEGGILTLKLGLSGESIVLDVTDTGRGIPPEDLDRVFEFAYTTREGGTGVGLAMVHQCVVEEHRGQVSIDSEPDKGTRVRLTLPIRAPEREADS